MKRLISKAGATLFAAVVLAISATGALASDFSGFYGGLSFGKVLGEGTHFPSGGGGAYGSASPDTSVIGGVFGWNERVGDFVFGYEIGVSAGLAGGDVFAHGCACSAMQLNFQGAVEYGMRGGWVSGDTLFYGALGGAYLGFEEIFTSTSAPTAITMENSDTVPYLGIGIEHAVADGWSIRGEYRQYFNVSTTNPTTPYPGSLTRLSSGAREYDFGVFAISLTRYF